MSPFVSELRACLSEILRGPVPAPEETDDPVRFFRQWLAERNLGLVPIRDAAAFDWPGPWIGVFRDGEDEHALVMFGSPSGVWLAPGGAYDGQRLDRVDAGQRRFRVRCDQDRRHRPRARRRAVGALGR